MPLHNMKRKTAFELSHGDDHMCMHVLCEFCFQHHVRSNARGVESNVDDKAANSKALMAAECDRAFELVKGVEGFH